MQSNSVIILDLNKAVVEQLSKAFSETNDFTVIYAGDDGDEGLKKILMEQPDLVVIGTFLKGTDGFTATKIVKRELPNTKIVSCGNPNDELIEEAMECGASYYLVKPFSVSVAINRMRDLLKNQTKCETKTNDARKSASIEEKISEIFISIGIPPHIKGYSYLREGIKMTIEKPYIINSVTKELYPAIAARFETTASKVERAIRHAIEVAWNRGRIDAINAIFGARLYLGTEKPTNSEFIALVADKLFLENMG